MNTILIVPGYGDSSPKHWQGIWLDQFPNALKVIQRDWIHANRREWVQVLDSTIQSIEQPVILVGHSLGCLTILFWVHGEEGKRSIHRVKGALFVAPPDPNSKAYRALPIEGFDPVPLNPLPFPSILVASTNDPFCPIEQARRYADALGSEFVNIGKRGHIGEDLGLGEWSEGKALLQKLFG